MKTTYYWNRFRNRRLNHRELKERRAVLSSFPYIAFIDPSNVCPLSCPLCPTGNKSGTHPKGFMSLETFQKICDQVGPYLYELHLYNWGEPLLNHRLPEMIEYAQKKYIPKIIASTNLAKVSDQWAEKIVRSGLDLLNVSIDGATQDTYEKYRVGGNLKEVMSTLKYMAEIRKSLGLKKPLLRWQFIPMKHNEHEIESARALAREIGVNFRIHRIRLNICDFDKKESQQTMEEQEGWAPQNPKYIRVKKKLGLDNICSFLWDRVVFNWDGSIVPCCKIYTAEDIFARNSETDFMDIWNGSAYIKAREIFIGKRSEDTFICQKCVDQKSIF